MEQIFAEDFTYDVLFDEVDCSAIPNPPKVPERLVGDIEDSLCEITAARSRGVFMRYYRDWNGEVIETVYAAKRFCKSRYEPEQKIRVQLIYVKRSDGAWSNYNLEFNVGGYTVTWKDHGGGWFIHEYHPVMERRDDPEYRPNLFCYVEQSYSEIMSLKNLPSHFVIPEEWTSELGTSDLIAYMRKFEKYPDIEKLVKMGLGYMWFDKRIYGGSEAYKAKMLSYIKANYTYILKNRTSSSDIIVGVKNGMTPKQVDENRVPLGVMRKFKDLGVDTISKAKAIAKYVGKNVKRWNMKDELCDYEDYIRLCKEMGRDLNDRGVWFPRDWKEQNASLLNAKDEKLSKEIDDGIASAIRNLGIPNGISGYGLTATLVMTKKEMIEISNKLHNCVGHAGYAEKEAKGLCLIMLVKQGDEYMNCVEITTPLKNKEFGGENVFKVNQNRGDYNSSSKVQCRSVALINKYVASINESMPRALA